MTRIRADCSVSKYVQLKTVHLGNPKEYQQREKEIPLHSKRIALI